MSSIYWRLPSDFMMVGSTDLGNFVIDTVYIWYTLLLNRRFFLRLSCENSVIRRLWGELFEENCRLHYFWAASCSFFERSSSRERTTKAVWLMYGPLFSAGTQRDWSPEKKSSAGPGSCVVGRASSWAEKWGIICKYYAKSASCNGLNAAIA